MGRLDEARLKIAFNDVDFCLKVHHAGYRNIWTPYAECYHHESVSRGAEDSPEKQARFNKEIEVMMGRWSELMKNDPFFNVNLSLQSEQYELAFPPRRDGLV